MVGRSFGICKQFSVHSVGENCKWEKPTTATTASAKFARNESNRIAVWIRRGAQRNSITHPHTESGKFGVLLMPRMSFKNNSNKRKTIEIRSHSGSNIWINHQPKRSKYFSCASFFGFFLRRVYFHFKWKWIEFCIRNGTFQDENKEKKTKRNLSEKKHKPKTFNANKYTHNVWYNFNCTHFLSLIQFYFWPPKYSSRWKKKDEQNKRKTERMKTVGVL